MGRPAIPDLTPPPPVFREPLPTDVAALTERVEMLEAQNRLEREKSTLLTVELDETREELAELKAEEPKPKTGWLRSLGGWFGAKEPPRKPALIKPDRPPEIEVRIGNCLDLIEPEENIYDAIVTDPPYALALHGYDWDSDISFMPALWERFFRVLKPGGYIAFFAAPRLYHRAAMVCEQAGFTLYPFMGWRFRDGLPKPINLSELFDRDNIVERDVIGVRRGSGFTQANVDHGAKTAHTSISPDTRAMFHQRRRLGAAISMASTPSSRDWSRSCWRRSRSAPLAWWTTCDCGEPVRSTSVPCRIAMAPGRVLSCRTARRKGPIINLIIRASSRCR